MSPTVTFTCSICGEPSGEICVFCTKDACANHVCEKCRRCSDCCECEIHLDEHPEPVAAQPPASDVVVLEEETVVVSEIVMPLEVIEPPMPESPADKPGDPDAA